MKYLENGGYSRIGGMRRATLKYQLDTRPCVRLCQGQSFVKELKIIVAYRVVHICMC